MKTLNEIEVDMFNVIEKVKEIEIDIAKLKNENITTPYWFWELNKILIDLSERTGISEHALRSKSHTREVAEVRQMYFRRAKETTTFSLDKIGQVVNRDHTTIIHGIKQMKTVPELIKKYDKYFGVEEIEEKKYLVPGGNKFVVIKPDYKSSFSSLPSANNREFHGYNEHQL